MRSLAAAQMLIFERLERLQMTQSGHLGIRLHGMICSTFQSNYSVDGHLEGPGETEVGIDKST